MILPKDGDSRSVPDSAPRALPLAVTYDATISASTQIDLNASTKWIEVTAIDKPVLVRWGTVAASTSAFHAVVLANTSRLLQVPAGIANVNFIEESATAKLAVIEHA